MTGLLWQVPRSLDLQMVNSLSAILFGMKLWDYFFNSLNTHSLKAFLSQETLATVVHAFVTSANSELCSLYGDK